MTTVVTNTNASTKYNNTSDDNKSLHRVRDVSLQECGGFRANPSRSVSWNSTGTYLASSSHNDRLTKLWACSDSYNGNGGTNANDKNNSSSNNGGGVLREFMTLTGHKAGVERVRFHPNDPNIICTSAEDKSVRLWDLRSQPHSLNNSNNNTSSSFGRIDLKSNHGLCAASIEWHPHRSYLAVTEKDNSVHVYDIRKMRNSSHMNHHHRTPQAQPDATDNSNDTVTSFRTDSFILQESHFSPSGTHLVSAAKRSSDGMGVLIAYPWNESGGIHRSSSSAGDNGTAPMDCTTTTSQKLDTIIPDDNVVRRLEDDTTNASVFVGHTGPIYAMKFSRNGQLLSTGGADALVSLWDVSNMVCTGTVSRRTKFIRSVAFSHDSKMVACCSEEEGIDLSDSQTGAKLGTVSLCPKNSRFQRGSDEVVFHPRSYLLACARGDNGSSVPQITIASLRMELR